MIKMYFGNAGCGKTTVATRSLFKAKKKYRHSVSNFKNTVKGVWFDDMVKLGTYKYPEHSLVVIDEAGVQYNNRSYKSMPISLISYIKKHRHFKNDIILFSQSWEDVDITFRRMVDELWYLKKIGPFTLSRKVRKFVTINDTDYQIIDGYKFDSLIYNILPFPFHRKTIELVYRPKYYKFFDSFEDSDSLPIFSPRQS